MAVADEAFGMKPWLMKPYPRKEITEEREIHNYRLSRARRTVENAFGILANRFRVFQQPMLVEPAKVVTITKAACALHNYLRTQTLTRQVYTPTSLMDQEDVLTGQIRQGTWRGEQPSRGLLSLVASADRNPPQEAKHVRDEYCAYFNTSGAVSWQRRAIGLE